MTRRLGIRFVLELAAGILLTAVPFALHAQTVTTTPHGVLSAPCAQCHLPDSWRPTKISADFKHAPDRFPLEGAHAKASCTTCHKRLDFTGVSATCASCHRDMHQGELGANCATCHSQRSFLDMTQMRRAHQLTAFPLTGLHAAADCRSCHTPRAPGQQAFVNRPTTCESCHLADYQKASNPPHASAGFPKDCASCHSASGWHGAPFDHAATQFPLTGSHRAVNCQGCHADKVYRGKPTTCVSCHQATYNQTKSPPHASAGFPTTCETCHNTTAWPGTPFDHSKTQFVLTGAHRAATCANCHGDGVYKGKPTACVSCHQTDFNTAKTPPHAGFPTTCESCHNTTAWPGAVFDHAGTIFPLTGAHKAVSCAGCHADGVYKGKATTCVSCHQTQYSQTKTPPHAAAGFPTTCETCHNTTAWPGAVFDHAGTIFPLTGAHKAVNCAGCHADGIYKGKPTTCVSCHQTEYNQTKTPPHAASGFPTTCETCHSTTAWPGAVFDHNTTIFPLTGAHKAVNCAGCHADGIYKGKPTTCVSCHQTEYNQTKTPPHAASGFPTSCETCHNTAQWPGAVFNHAATPFPLTGAHVSVTCAQCHADGVYKGKPTTCVSCHQTDYNATTNPGHSAARFPTDCASCHTTATWLGATFNHDASFFPIYSGAHAGKWSTCATCHTNAANFAVFDCLSCHTKSQTDGEHKGRAGYVYASPNCYACHPRGKT
jgi:hypothetical protein